MNELRKNIKATWAVAKADLISSFSNMSNVFFGLLFPLIFVVVFVFLGGGNRTYLVGVSPEINKQNPLYKALDEVESIEFIEGSKNDLEDRLKKGDLTAYLEINSTENGQSNVVLSTTAAEPEDGQIILTLVNGIVDKLNLALSGVAEPPVKLETNEIAGRKFTQIDYILPGQLGFALMNSGIFGTSFLFVNLRDTLVIKRFFATPIKKYTIILGVGISKLVFAMIQASIILVVGTLFMDYTLVNGMWTFVGTMGLSAIGIIIFLGVGFIVSSLAKDENAVSSIANIFTLPQFLLAGTFFPVEVFPEWLQPVSKVLPLTYLSNAMRALAFDGAGLNELKDELFALLVCVIVVYVIAVKTFKWDSSSH